MRECVVCRFLVRLGLQRKFPNVQPTQREIPRIASRRVRFRCDFPSAIDIILLDDREHLAQCDKKTTNDALSAFSQRAGAARQTVAICQVFNCEISKADIVVYHCRHHPCRHDFCSRLRERLGRYGGSCVLLARRDRSRSFPLWSRRDLIDRLIGDLFANFGIQFK